MRVAVRVERYPLANAFTISRGAKAHVDVVACEIEDRGVVGRGEATPIYYRGETAEGCVAAIRNWAKGAHDDRERLQHELPPGAVRNALDCALWDLEAQRAGAPIWRFAGLPRPRPVATAWTLSLDTPEEMARSAARAVEQGFALLKLKLGGDGHDPARAGAIRAAAPSVRLIADANESWRVEKIVAQARTFAGLGIELIEQPLPHGADQALAGMRTAVPLCADESCHTVADLPSVIGRYQAVNVKLDKAGGLTAAIALIEAAREAGLEVMLGCMLASSQAVRFALALAPLARWIDLDAPALLSRDRAEGLRYEDGLIVPD